MKESNINSKIRDLLSIKQARIDLGPSNLLFLEQIMLSRIEPSNEIKKNILCLADKYQIPNKRKH